MSERHDLWKIADALQMDLRAAQAKLTELRAQLAALDLPPDQRHECMVCGVRFRTLKPLAEHYYLHHDGPEPEHWRRAEALAR